MNHKSVSRMIRSSAVALSCAVALMWLASGCASPEEKAQKLFGEGKYDEVVSKYPDTPTAEQAREKIAEKLYNEGKYDEVLKTFGQTPIAAKAKAQFDELSAKKLFDAKNYEDVLKQYPNSQTAMAARDSLGRKLYGDMYSNPDGWEKLRAQFPMKSDASGREVIAKGEYDRIIKLPARERKMAFETFVQNPQYKGTLADAKARKELGKKG